MQKLPTDPYIAGDWWVDLFDKTALEPAIYGKARHVEKGGRFIDRRRSGLGPLDAFAARAVLVTLSFGYCSHDLFPLSLIAVSNLYSRFCDSVGNFG